jgi:hypothetical protein
VNIVFLMPYADLHALEPYRRASAVPDLFTVDLVARFIAWKLDQNLAAPKSSPGDLVPNARRLPVDKACRLDTEATVGEPITAKLIRTPGMALRSGV